MTQRVNPAGYRKDGKHWTETATPEQLEAWKAKMKAGQTKFFVDRKKGRGRPKKFNYKKGWNPAKKSAASKATWEKWKTERPNARKNFYEAGHRATRKKLAREQPLRDERRWAEENKVKRLVDGEIQKEQDRLYEIAKSVLTESGIEPEKDQPIEYYKEIINFFKPGTV